MSKLGAVTKEARGGRLEEDGPIDVVAGAPAVVVH
jgi:hypothetical protein